MKEEYYKCSQLAEKMCKVIELTSVSVWAKLRDHLSMLSSEPMLLTQPAVSFTSYSICNVSPYTGMCNQNPITDDSRRRKTY